VIAGDPLADLDALTQVQRTYVAGKRLV
jgi:hypothetical protein